jgi:hypothetical protein
MESPRVRQLVHVFLFLVVVVWLAALVHYVVATQDWWTFGALLGWTVAVAVGLVAAASLFGVVFLGLVSLTGLLHRTNRNDNQR